jgi:hypothetical protein
MKLKLLFIALAFSLMSSTCSSEDTPQTNDCTCFKVFYDYGVVVFGQGGVQPIWGYTQVGRIPATNVDCAGTDYVQIDSNSYYKIECE